MRIIFKTCKINCEQKIKAIIIINNLVHKLIALNLNLVYPRITDNFF